jgi:hypothetical protein
VAAFGPRHFQLISSPNSLDAICARPQFVDYSSPRTPLYELQIGDHRFPFRTSAIGEQQNNQGIGRNRGEAQLSKTNGKHLHPMAGWPKRNVRSAVLLSSGVIAFYCITAPMAPALYRHTCDGGKLVFLHQVPGAVVSLLYQFFDLSLEFGHVVSCRLLFTSTALWPEGPI